MEKPRHPAKGRPTRRLSPTERRRLEPPPPPLKERNPWLIALFVAGGVILLLIIISIATCGGGPAKKPRPERPKKTKPKPKPPPPRRPDVSNLETEGKSKCEKGLSTIRPWLSPSPGSPKEAIRNGLESGLQLLKQGLEAYKEASRLGGKVYKVSEFETAWREGIILFCPDIESEGKRKCEEGLSTIRSSEARMGSTMLDEEQKRTLREELVRGKKLIEEGLNLLERSHEASGHRFDTTAYGQARKAASMKILELKK